MTINLSDLTFTPPTAHDGVAVHQLIAQCPPLDTNSTYCNLLQCSHFADSCLCVKDKRTQELIGFVSGYIPPKQSDTLFIWQIALAPQARGQGIAMAMLTTLLSQPSLLHVRFIETTITQDNQPSNALFARLAKQLNATLSREAHFDQKQHFANQHQSEFLVRLTLNQPLIH